MSNLRHSVLDTESTKKGYKQTEIGMIPETWEVNPLGDLCYFLRGSALSKGDLVDNGKNKCIHYGELFTTYQEKIFHIRSSTNLLDGQMSKIGDILMPSSDVTPQGLATASAIFEDGVIIGGDTNILRPKIDLDSLFLSYFMNFNKKEIMKAVTGTTVRHIYNKDLAKLYIPLPPLPEQQKIAEILSTVDQKIDSIDSKIEETQTLKRGLMQRLLSEGIGHSEFKDTKLGGVPTSWEVVKLVEAINIMTDYVAAGSFASLAANVTVYDEENYAVYVRLFDLRKGLGHKDQKYVDKYSYDFLKKSNLQGNEILIANIGANVGETFLMPFIDKPATLAPNMIEVKVNVQKISSEFLYFYLTSGVGLLELDKVIEGSGQPKINKTKLKTIIVPLPPLSEQKQIVEILSTTDEKLESLRAKKETFETLKKGLMQKLLSGEVRVNV